MSYKIVVDSCCELPEELKHDPRCEIVPLTLIVEIPMSDWMMMDLIRRNSYGR